jgi:hypothetical protein
MTSFHFPSKLNEKALTEDLSLCYHNLCFAGILLHCWNNIKYLINLIFIKTTTWINAVFSERIGMGSELAVDVTAIILFFDKKHLIYFGFHVIMN